MASARPLRSSPQHDNAMSASSTFAQSPKSLPFVPLMGCAATPAANSGGVDIELGDPEAAMAVAGATRTPPTARAPLCLAALALSCVCSMLMEVSLFWKFTPVYTETECGNQTAMMDRMSVGVNSIDIGLEIQVSCRNPNPYGISVLASTPGQVFVQVEDRGKTKHVSVGDLHVVPGSQMGEYGSGVVRVRMDTKLKGSEAEALLPHFLWDKAVPIMMQLQFNVGVGIYLGLGSWSVAAPFKKACGLNMAGVLVNQFLPQDNSQRSNRLGPLVCRDSFDGLNGQLPPVGDKAETPEDGNMGFTAAQVAPVEVASGELLKNVSLGTSFVMSLLMFLVFTLTSLASVGHRAGFAGLMDDVKAARHGFSLQVWTGNARNGALAILAGVLGCVGIRAQIAAWEVPQEKLTPISPDPRETEVGRCSKCVCRPYDSETLIAEWLRSLLGGGDRRKGGSLQAVGKDAVERTKSGVYQRLSTVAVDAVQTPERSLDRGRGSSSSPSKPGAAGDASPTADAPQRSKTVPVLNAVSAKRARLMEAPWHEDARPPSPPLPFDIRQASRSSMPAASAAYVPGDASPALATDVASPMLARLPSRALALTSP